MSRMNHARINLQKRIIQEARTEREQYFPPQKRRVTQSTFGASPFGWLKLQGGKYKGLTLPQLLFTDVGYLNWLMKENIFFEPLGRPWPTQRQKLLAHQLMVIANRGQHILPPGYRTNDQGFAIVVDDEGVFERLVLIEKECPQPIRLEKGERIIRRTTELDVTTILGLHNPRLGNTRLAASMCEHYFPGRGMSLKAAEIDLFCADAERFRLNGCDSHTTVTWTLRDHRKLLALHFGGSVGKS